MENNITKKLNRCSICNKRVGINYFTCKCDEHIKLCTLHRYKDEHSCTLNHKEIWKEQFIKENPPIHPNKVIKV